MKSSWRVEVPQLAILALLYLASAGVWSHVPDQIPVHWNLAGEVDRYGSRMEGLLAIPVLASVLFLLLRFLPRLDPAAANYARFAGAYTLIRYALLIFLAALHVVLISTALGRPVDMGMVISVLIGLLFVALGSVMRRLQPNWFVGVRTPWTLTSELSWLKTHRLAQWLFIGIGLATAVLGGLGTRWALIGMLVLLGGGGLCLVVYSYFVWRTDPDRSSPGRTTHGVPKS